MEDAMESTTAMVTVLNITDAIKDMVIRFTIPAQSEDQIVLFQVAKGRVRVEEIGATALRIIVGSRDGDPQ